MGRVGLVLRSRLLFNGFLRELFHVAPLRHEGNQEHGHQAQEGGRNEIDERRCFQSCAFDAERQNVARQNTQTEQTQAYANGDGGRRAALLQEKARLPIGMPSFWLVPRLV